MVKLFGALLIFVTGVLFGFYRASQYADRPKHIRQCIQALQRLETEINYGMTPLPQALERTSQAIHAPLSTILYAAYEKLQLNDSRTTSACWSEAWNEGKDRTAMKGSELNILHQLGTTLGISDRQDQIKHLHLAINHLKSEEITAKEEQQRYEKMWRSLGALGGALLVILMY